MNRSNQVHPTITAYNAGKPLYTRYIKGKSDLIEFLNLFPNALSILVAETDKKVIPECPDSMAHLSRYGYTPSLIGQKQMDGIRMRI
jgi:hypothetical protein